MRKMYLIGFFAIIFAIFFISINEEKNEPGLEEKEVLRSSLYLNENSGSATIEIKSKNTFKDLSLFSNNKKIDQFEFSIQEDMIGNQEDEDSFKLIMIDFKHKNKLVNAHIEYKLCQSECKTITLLEDKTENQRAVKEKEVKNNKSISPIEIISFLFIGMMLAFTPCVFPMYPILSSMIIGGKKEGKEALFLSSSYVFGMAFSYSIIGLIVAYIGLQAQSLMQSPSIIIASSLLLVLFSISMFGFINIKMPSSWESLINKILFKMKGGTYKGAFLIGSISGLVASPCTTAPLSGILLYVADTGNLVSGGISLFVLAIGMGIPLIAISIFGKYILPKSGEWMNKIKTIMGMIMLSVPIVLLERILSEEVIAFLWLLLAVIFLSWSASQIHMPGEEESKLKTKVNILMITISILFVIFSFLNLNDFYHKKEVNIVFKDVHNISELKEEINISKQLNLPMIIDFYADWCIACKRFEKITFKDDNVEKLLEGYRLIRIDLTKVNEENNNVFKEMKILGLPALDIYDENGKSKGRINGFMDPDEFIERINK